VTAAVGGNRIVGRVRRVTTLLSLAGRPGMNPAYWALVAGLEIEVVSPLDRVCLERNRSHSPRRMRWPHDRLSLESPALEFHSLAAVCPSPFCCPSPCLSFALVCRSPCVLSALLFLRLLSFALLVLRLAVLRLAVLHLAVLHLAVLRLAVLHRWLSFHDLLAFTLLSLHLAVLITLSCPSPCCSLHLLSFALLSFGLLPSSLVVLTPCCSFRSLLFTFV